LGVVTETNVIAYGSGNKGGYIITEKKKRSKDEQPYIATIAHYYAVSNGNFIVGSKLDIGLFVIVKVQASNEGGMDVKVEGPMQHPVAALFYMFEKVSKTGIWKPTSCPHCARIKKQQQHNLMPSETEDSDNFPPPRRSVAKQMGVCCVMNNDGAIKGNHNANLTVNSRQSFFGRFWK
jgi:hypothetical protein